MGREPSLAIGRPVHACCGLKSGLIRGRSVASGTDSFHRDVQVADGGGHGWTHSRRLGKRVARVTGVSTSAGGGRSLGHENNARRRIRR
jgi:hypothetical protein